MTEDGILSAAETKFVLGWGEMGNRWGLNRTMAQVHALLYIAEEPLDADLIMRALGVSRSNVSTSLRELLGWGVVRKVALLGKRRTYYESLTDLWDMFRRVVRERKQRELDPTFDIVRECLNETDQGERHVRRRLEELVKFFDAFSRFYEELDSMDRKTAERMFKAGSKLRRLFGGKAR